MSDRFRQMTSATPARLDVGRAGPRYTTSAMLQFRADHARAVDAVRNEIPKHWAKRHRMMEVASEAASRELYLLHPEAGRRLRASDAAKLKRLRSRQPEKRPTVML